MPTVSVWLPADVYKALRRKAEELGVNNLSSLIRDALVAYLGIEVKTAEAPGDTIAARISRLEEKVQAIEAKIAELEAMVSRLAGVQRWLNLSKQGKTRQ